MRAALEILAVLMALAALPLLTRLDSALRARRVIAGAIEAGRFVLAVAAASLLIAIAGRLR